MKCLICNEEINTNHLRKHNISTREYYDKYLKKEWEGICLNCKTPTKYVSFNIGYRKRCPLCANREIGRLKEEKYKLFKEYKICKICNKQFLTDKRKNKEICGSKRCRQYSPKDPRNIKDVKYFDESRCPYCNKFCGKYTTLHHHLLHHFPINEVANVFNYLWDFVWKKKTPKCKNPKCNKKCSKFGLDTFYNFCDDCKKLDEFKNTSAIKYIYTKKELKNIRKRAGKSIKKFYDNLKNDPDKLNKFKKQWEISGKRNSILLKKFYSTEQGKTLKKKMSKKQSKIMKKLILEGKFTPNITNRWTHWDAFLMIGGKKVKFRSSWEACFFHCNNNLEYESIRIKYIDEQKKEKSTIVDFFDRKNKVLYEIKPRSIFLIQKNKMDAVIEYCLNNKIKFIWINESNILDYIDKSKFSADNIIQYDKMLCGINNENNKNKKNN